MTDKNISLTLKELANSAIAKHTRKIFKYESRVLQDKDPENLHQMRVGMRRLRSAIAGLEVALDLPRSVDRENLARIGRSLGKLRDLDVLLVTLTADYRPFLSKKEQKNLDRAIAKLSKQRQKEVRQVGKTLNGKLYLHLKQGLKSWLDEPQYQKIGECSIYSVLPDLLLPQISQLLLHPGWLVGVEIEQGQIRFPQILNQEAIRQLSAREDLVLHSLRKSAKKTRYNLELFSRFYGDTYQYYLKQIEQIQEILGQIQDVHVLRKILEKVLKSPIADLMPELANLLLKNRYHKWLEWQILQQQFLENKTRQEFRQAIQQPLSSSNY